MEAETLTRKAVENFVAFCPSDPIVIRDSTGFQYHIVDVSDSGVVLENLDEIRFFVDFYGLSNKYTPLGSPDW